MPTAMPTPRPDLARLAAIHASVTAAAPDTATTFIPAPEGTLGDTGAPPLGPDLAADAVATAAAATGRSTPTPNAVWHASHRYPWTYEEKVGLVIAPLITAAIGVLFTRMDTTTAHVIGFALLVAAPLTTLTLWRTAARRKNASTLLIACDGHTIRVAGQSVTLPDVGRDLPLAGITDMAVTDRRGPVLIVRSTNSAGDTTPSYFPDRLLGNVDWLAPLLTSASRHVPTSDAARQVLTLATGRADR